MSKDKVQFSDDSLSDYREALVRLEKNRPKILPKGTRICNDAVSLEAGRKKGSIKKSRPGHAALIEDIKSARKRQIEPIAATDANVEKHKKLHSECKKKYKESLGLQINLAVQVERLEGYLREIKEKGL